MSEHLQGVLDLAKELKEDARIDYCTGRVIDQYVAKARHANSWLNRCTTAFDGKAMLDGANIFAQRLLHNPELSDEVKQIVRKELVNLLKDQRSL